MPLPFEKNIKNAMFILVERVMYFVSVHLEILKKILGVSLFLFFICHGYKTTNIF